MQPVLPLVEIVLGCVALRGVLREARRGDHDTAAAEKLQAAAVANLDTGAGDNADPVVEASNLLALGIIELGAVGAQLVIE